MDPFLGPQHFLIVLTVLTEIKRIMIKVNTTQTITIGPTNQVSENELFRIEDTSKTKWSVIVETQTPK